MAKNVLSHALSPMNISRIAVGAAVAAGAFLAGSPAFAADDTGDRAPVAAAVAQKPRQITAAAVLKVAESQVGVSENAAGGGTPFHQWYMSSPRAKETVARDGGSIGSYANAPWCAMFVSWVGEKVGARPTVGWDAYTVSYAKWFEENGRWGTTAKPGAVVYFSWSGSKDLTDINHMGFVVKDNQDGTISTIEGNTGNGRVEERIRPTSQVVGYGYPQYQG
ncbi:CHAP domain-containing protein [Nonomuraea basaltis]|uniref:CHAP domain-containing protein n=1 Tax=Nonomuraea basaltis TaxID=2495887 RepID=UPI00110C6B6E|nr:CHAP domain-containing protein [Nonomuraea basaltis]TMR99843.1 CHAP domain-containing protein [Nonomuraea basaltis]